MKQILPIIAVLFSLLMVQSCRKAQVVEPVDYDQIIERDTLVVATMYGSSSYFTLKGEEMGFDYELCRDFAEAHNLKLKVIIANNVSDLTDLLESRQVDLVAYRLPITNDLKQQVNFVANEYVTNQVLVQRRSRNVVTNVVGLIGKKIAVNKNSKYEERLKNLNAEIGGGIDIQLVDDSLTIDNLIEMVSLGDIEFTVAENDIALLNKTYFQNIDCKLPISFPQRAAWALRKDTPKLEEEVDKWFKEINAKEYNALYNKYFIQAKFFGDYKVKVGKGAISPYDDLLKKYAQQLNWDWHLLAAICYEESRFDYTATSWSGARGLMQLMPRTFAIYCNEGDDIEDPEANIRASTLYLKALVSMFKNVPDKEERLKFILAAYNAGQAHIFDAMALAEKYNKEKYIWYNNVEEYLLLKSRKEYYTDPVVKSGYFRGEFAVRYVTDVLHTFERFRRQR
jgi:membrane-bound lytic murein transglycosylase F